MADKIKLDIKIISRENIKPSTPTPSNLKTIKLSLIDQLFTPAHIPLLLYYNIPPNTPPPQTTTLKSSLSQTLSQFYRLAGRCIDDSTVSCNDEGVPFIETRVNSTLNEFLTSVYKQNFLMQLLPPRGKPNLELVELVPLAFQINVFACGGIVIGCFMFHKLLDLSSLGTFFRYWAALTTQQNPNMVNPNFDHIFEAFPPCPTMDRVIVNDPTPESPPLAQVAALAKYFRVTKTAINNLKAMAATEAYPNPTSFETVTAFVWENVVAAACIAHGAAPEQVQETSIMSLVINMRSRTNPPLPREAMGNCVFDLQTKAIKQGATLQELVWVIHGAVSESKSIVEKFQGVNGAEMVREYRMVSNQVDKECRSNVYRLTSWCKLGLNEADFGFGKANVIHPLIGKAPPILRNKMVFTDYYDDINGDGIELWLVLEEKEMQVLETNPRFLEFAFPT